MIIIHNSMMICNKIKVKRTDAEFERLADGRAMLHFFLHVENVHVWRRGDCYIRLMKWLEERGFCVLKLVMHRRGDCSCLSLLIKVAERRRIVGVCEAAVLIILYFTEMESIHWKTNSGGSSLMHKICKLVWWCWFINNLS